MLTIGASRDFGQREHITVILSLPYLLLILARTRNEAPSLTFAVLVGTSAAVGFGFKPYLLVVPLFTEIYLSFKIGIRRTFFRPEAIAAVTTAVSYVGAVLLFARPYLSESLPDIARVYWAFDRPGYWQFILASAWPLILLVSAALHLPWRNRQPGATLFSLSSAGFMLAAVMQWKAYSYHFYPVIAYSALAFVILFSRAGLARVVGPPILAVFALMQVKVTIHQIPIINVGDARAAMARFVDTHTRVGGRFIAMSTHPFPGFPTALLTHAVWGARSNSCLYLPAVVRLRFHHLFADAGLLAFATTKAHEAMLIDMRPLPDLVLVDVHPVRHAIYDLPFDFVAFYNEDPAFAALWRKYKEVPGAPAGYRAYILRSEGER